MHAVSFFVLDNGPRQGMHTASIQADGNDFLFDIHARRGRRHLFSVLRSSGFYVLFFLCIGSRQEMSKETKTETNQVFLDPKHYLTQEQLEAYAAKTRRIQLYTPKWLFANGHVGKRMENGEYQDSTNEEYDQEMLHPSQPKLLIGTPFKDLTNAYMFEWKLKPIEKYDVLDKLLMADQGKTWFLKRELFGLHTYGGYAINFRPDLTEVFHMLHVSGILPEQFQVLYVTTSVYPSYSAHECLDPKTDKHRAKTTCFYLPI